MNGLVEIRRNDAITDSMRIAEGTENQHHAVQQIIRKYSEKFERWGRLEFTHLKCGKRGRPAKVYILNEGQALFLMTLLDNNDIVLEFKAELVDQFCKMKDFIRERQSEAWIETRKNGKLTRRSETGTIKELVEYAKGQGSKHSHMLYITYSKLANKMAGIESRDLATVKQLNSLDEVEGMILHVIRLGMAGNKHYKEIYADCKRRLEFWQDCTFRLTA